METTYKGKPRKQHLILVSWELHGEGTQTKSGEPMMVSKRYTFSLGDRAILRQDIESWRAKPLTEDEAAAFDILRLLGAPCLLTLAKSEDGKYLNVTTVSKIIKGTPVPERTHNKLTSLVLTKEDFNPAVFESLSDGLRDMIAKSPEYQAIKTGKSVSTVGKEPEFDDEIPF